VVVVAMVAVVIVIAVIEVIRTMMCFVRVGALSLSVQLW